MPEPLRNLGLWLLRLLPANPILVRVVQGGGRRIRHLWIRVGYLSVLFLVMLMALLTSQSNAGGGLVGLAKTSTQTFTAISVVQMAMVCFLSPIFAAAAITQEKDAQTYNILLATPLSNGQIVLGSLASRLYFVLALLFAGFPIFCITLLFGGVTLREVVLSFSLAAATAVFTGVLAIAISVIQVGTRRTIFAFYVMIAVYLVAVEFAGLWTATAVVESPVNTSGYQMSWLAAVHPFLALWAALGMTTAPAFETVAHYGWPRSFLAAYPHYSYIVLTLMLSALIVGLSMLFVRRSVKLGELTLLQRIGNSLRRGRGADERTRKPRHVWSNPVAWREAITRASAMSRALTRFGLVGGGILIGVILLLFYHSGYMTTATARDWLTGLVMVEFAVVLLAATNTAATAMTREKEADTMDLLLVTPLTSKYIVWGKLRGLVSYTIPFLAIPLVTLTIFCVRDLLFSSSDPIVYPEAIPQMMLLLVLYAALACIVGLQTSLKSRKTVKSVLTAVGILVIALLALTPCGWTIMQQDDTEKFGPFLAPFTPFTSIALVVNPARALNTPKIDAPADVRIFSLMGTLAAVTLYSLIVWGMHRSLVRNFDMTVRKQSAQ